MRLTGSGAYARPTPTPKMPPGLIELMEGMTKDVLKHNPEDIYQFCAGHMQKLLDIRDGTVPKKQLSLDDKIKRAQEKIRQRIQDRQLQYQKEMPELLNETGEDKNNITDLKNLTVVETPVEITTVLKQPVHHGDESVNIKEVEIFHEPDVIITTTAINNVDALKKPEEVKECLPIVTETVQDNEFIRTVDEEVKEINLDIKSDTPISPAVETRHSAELNDDVKKEAEQCVVDIVVDTPATLEAIQSATSTSLDLKEEHNEDMVESEPVPSNILKNEESKHEVEVQENEKTNDNNTEIVAEIKHVIHKSDNATDVNPEDIPKEIQNADIPTNPEEIPKPSESILDNTTVEGKAEEKPIVIDVQEVIKNVEKEIIPDQPMKEILVTENVPSDKSSNVIQIDSVTEDKVVDQEKNGDASNVIENNTVAVAVVNNSSNVNNDVQTVLNESKTGVEKNSIEPLIETPLESSTTIENQSTVNHAEASAETITPVQLVTLNEVQTLPTATPIDPQEHINNHIVEKVHQNDIDNKSLIDEDTATVTDEQHNSAAELFVNGNNIHNNTSDSKNDIIAESDETIENAEGSGMDLETAAITIQKVFRTFLFSKSQASTLDDTANDNSLDEEIEKKNFQDEPEYIIPSPNLNKERRTLGISRMDTVLQTVNEEKSLSLSTDDSSTLSSAATTIQAHVRGFLVRNRLASHRTASNSSLVNSEGPSIDGETNEPKKTILNIHIVPERGQFMSRDESMLTSIDLPLDNSPPSSINLHPLGYDKSEPRKQLKREDAIQSISPPSNNSGKLSEEVDSVKDSIELKQAENSTPSLTSIDKRQDVDTESIDTTLTISSTADTVVEVDNYTAREVFSSPEHNSETDVRNDESGTNFSSDEMDVVTPFPNATEKPAQVIESEDKPKLVHTGEFHDIVLQTQVKRSESSVVRGE